MKLKEISKINKRMNEMKNLIITNYPVEMTKIEKIKKLLTGNFPAKNLDEKERKELELLIKCISMTKNIMELYIFLDRNQKYKKYFKYNIDFLGGTLFHYITEKYMQSPRSKEDDEGYLQIVSNHIKFGIDIFTKEFKYYPEENKYEYINENFINILILNNIDIETIKNIDKIINIKDHLLESLAHDMIILIKNGNKNVFNFIIEINENNIRKQIARNSNIPDIHYRPYNKIDQCWNGMLITTTISDYVEKMFNLNYMGCDGLFWNLVELIKKGNSQICLNILQHINQMFPLSKEYTQELIIKTIKSIFQKSNIKRENFMTLVLENDHNYYKILYILKDIIINAALQDMFLLIEYIMNESNSRTLNNPLFGYEALYNRIIQYLKNVKPYNIEKIKEYFNSLTNFITKFYFNEYCFKIKDLIYTIFDDIQKFPEFETNNELKKLYLNLIQTLVIECPRYLHYLDEPIRLYKDIPNRNEVIEIFNENRILVIIKNTPRNYEKNE
jgi:hypothetical protein